jgi:CheY-like chemotaxis protein
MPNGSETKTRRNILVLEDEALMAIMLEHELESIGLHVIGPVCNLQSANLLAETAELDAALLDLHINGDYATEVADKLRARGIPFIFVTGYDAEGLRYQDVPVLRKPFTGLELRSALLALLEA